MALVETISGIRGIYGEELTSEIVNKYAQAFLKLMKKKTGKENPVIVIGMDSRPSSKYIHKIMINSFPGCIDLEYSPTPMTELGVREYDADGGVMITASHNPKEHNGLKFLDSTGGILQPEDAKYIINESKSINFKELSENHQHKNKHDDIIEVYYNFLSEILGENAKALIKNAQLSVLIDPNGGAGVYYKEVLERFGVTVKTVNNELGIFEREIEPTVNSLKPLQEALENEEFAAGFDCDADRVELVTKEDMMSGNHVLAMVIDSYLEGCEDAKKETVVVNDCTSQLVKKVAEKHGAKYVEAPVGEINIVNAMVDNRANIGGEGSNGGGILYPGRCRDGLMCVLLILKLIANRNRNVKEIIDGYTKYYNKQKKVKVDNYSQEKVVEQYKTKGQVNLENESVKVQIDDSYIWFRMSKTEHNLLRFIADSPNEQKVDELLEEAEKIINQ